MLRKEINNNMNKHMETAIKGIYHEYAGKRLQVLADLNIILDHPAGVGDHAVHTKDIKDKLETLEHLNSMLDTINEEYSEVTMPDQNTEAIKQAETVVEDACCTDDSCDCD